MTKRNQFINSRGEIIDTEDGVCPDGYGLRTNIFMLDHGLDDTQREIARSYSRPAQITDRSHQPGFRLANAASNMQDAASAARATRKKLLSDAWRTTDALNEQAGAWSPTETPDLVPFKPSPDVDAAGSLSAAYLAEKVRVSNAWRTPAASGNSTESKAAAFTRNWAASYAPYQQGDAATTDAYAAMVNRQQNAWRQGA
jgi:hypothetical protein